MEDLEKENPKHNVVRDSDNGPSPMVDDNAGEDTAENNNETSTNDNPAPSLNTDQEEGHSKSMRSDVESNEERSPEEPQLR